MLGKKPLLTKWYTYRFPKGGKILRNTWFFMVALLHFDWFFVIFAATGVNYSQRAPSFFRTIYHSNLDAVTAITRTLGTKDRQQVNNKFSFDLLLSLRNARDFSRDSVNEVQSTAGRLIQLEYRELDTFTSNHFFSRKIHLKIPVLLWVSFRFNMVIENPWIKYQGLNERTFLCLLFNSVEPNKQILGNKNLDK